MDKYLDQIVKAPMGAKLGGLAVAVVLLTAANFFLFVSPLEDEIANQSGVQRKLTSSFTLYPTKAPTFSGHG